MKTRMQAVVWWLAKKYSPELIAERAELLESMKALGAKLRQTRDELECYRQRCFSAENALTAAKRGVVSEMQKHDKSHHTALQFRS